MSPRDRIIEGMRELLEEQYLESVSDRSKAEYAGLSDVQKRAILKAFLRKLTAWSEAEEWVKMLEEIL